MSRTIKQLSHDVYYGMGSVHQITIDLVEDVEEFMLNITGEKNNYVKENFSSWEYKINNLLEVFDPNLDSEREILKDLSKICNEEAEKCNTFV